MGSLKAHNPVHLDNGAAYRRLTGKLKRIIKLASQFPDNSKARQIHDYYLARQAALASVILSNSGSGLLPYAQNATAKDFGKSAYNQTYFVACFNRLIEEVRQ